MNNKAPSHKGLSSTSPTLNFGIREISALGACVLALVLVFVLGSTAEYSLSVGVGLYAPDRLIGIGLYTLLYMVLTLIAFQRRSGILTGFQHSAIVAAYLTHGPIAAFTASLVGVILAQVVGYFFRKPLGLSSFGLREAINTLLMTVGVDTLPTLMAGAVYRIFGPSQPLLVSDPQLLWPLIVFLAVDLTLYGVAATIHASGVVTPPSKSTISAAIRTLIVCQICALPLTLILPVAYYELPLLAFVLLVVAVIVAGVLFQRSERSRRALEQRVGELATLNSFGPTISSSLTMVDLMQSIHARVSDLMDVPFFYIALYATETQTLSFPFAMRDGKPVSLEPYQIADGVNEYIIRTGKPLLVRGSVNAEFRKLGIRPADTDNACYLGVPLAADGGVMGVLGVQNATDADAYSESDMIVLSALASHAAIALRNAGLYNRVWEMADNLAVLNNVSSMVTATLDLDSVLRTTCRVVIEIGHADKTAIFLVSEDGLMIHLVHSLGLSPNCVRQLQNLPLDGDSGPAHALRQRNVTMALPDVWTDPRGEGWRVQADAEGYIGLLTVPLVASEQVIGFLAAFYQQPHLFGKSELDLMNTLANQVAVTVANARLYADAQSRAHEMASLVESSRAFTASLDLNSVAEKVLEELIRILSPNTIALMLANSDGTRLYPLAQRGIDSINPMTPVGSVARAIETRKASMLVNSGVDRVLLQEFELEALYVIPLVSQDKVIGVVSVGYERIYQLSLRQRQLAEALVNQAATAVRNAQLFSQTDAALTDRVAELSAIEAISRQISGALDLESIINDVLDTALTVSQADLASCGLVTDPESIHVIERYSTADPVLAEIQPRKMKRSRHGGIMGRVLRTGIIARVANTSVDPDFMPPDILNIQSELTVPIVHKRERLGVINLESRHPDAFTALHERFLVNLADHAAIAIDNVRLFEERQIQIDILTMLHSMSLTLLSATSLQMVMDIIVQYALAIAHAKDVHLYLYDPAADTLNFGASLWLDGRQNVEAVKPERGGSTSQVARSGQKEIIEDVTQLDPSPQFKRGPGFGAAARIPLKRGNRVLGVLVIAFREAHYFSDNENRALDLLANHAAIAIENARLFDEARTGRDQMQVILNSARDGMMLIGADSTLILTNPAAERLLNFSLRHATGQSILRLLAKLRREESQSPGAPALLKASRILLKKIQQKPDEIARESFELETLNGSIDIEATVLPVGEDVGGGRLIVVRDVSKEKSIERFRWQTIHMVVHDLRAPITGVISSLQLAGDLVAMRDFGELDQVTGIALINSKDMLEKVESILEIAQMETADIELKVDTWALKPLVGKAIAAIDQLASDAAVQVLDCVPPNLPPLQMDEALIRRVVVNMLDNALRHTPSGGQVRVEAFLAADKQFAEIVVVDTGKGIPPELRENIFEKFFRVQKSALRGRLGFGLGLTFCKLAVEAHGGRVWVKDGPEGGAAFWFTLPVAQTEKAN